MQLTRPPENRHALPTLINLTCPLLSRRGTGSDGTPPMLRRWRRLRRLAAALQYQVLPLMWGLMRCGAIVVNARSHV
jgi:hypothetical protein